MGARPAPGGRRDADLLGLLQGSLVPSELVSAASEGGTPEACAAFRRADGLVGLRQRCSGRDLSCLPAGRRSPRARPCPKMLSGHSTCLFSGLCAALLAVALTYYFYW